MERESLAVLLAQGWSVEKIATRFGKHASTISYWMRKYELAAPNRDKHAAKGGLDQGALQAMVESGMTLAEIADVVQMSKTTVRYWVLRHGLQTKHSAARRRRLELDAAGWAEEDVTMSCERHGDTVFVLGSHGRYRCRRCRSEAVSRRRRRVKAILVAEAGGRCILCGYDRHPSALHFHHVDPINKRVAINAKGVALALDTVRAEAAKCVLLCANCHAEVGGRLRMSSRYS
jgi:transposase